VSKEVTRCQVSVKKHQFSAYFDETKPHRIKSFFLCAFTRVNCLSHIISLSLSLCPFHFCGASLNIGQFVSSFAAVPILLIAASYGDMFLIFGLASLGIGALYVIGYLKIRRAPKTA